MFDIGFSELMLVGVLGLIILGPERLPKAAHTMGLMVGRVRRTMAGFQQQIEEEVHIVDIKEQLKNPIETLLADEKSLEPAPESDVSCDTLDPDGSESKDADLMAASSRETVTLT